MLRRQRLSERHSARPAGGPVRWIVVGVAAVLLFGWVFLYRFNTLGGSFGGFDNDHFLDYAVAKQVQAGEQPLRDFQDGMHGAWPSLTYEFSAAAQRFFGNNLRSEAWLTVGGMALGTTVAYVAGSMIASWPWALATAWLSALMAPKLYGYPKVLVTAVAALILVAGREGVTWRRVVLMSVWTAIAFLFRHDYAVYCAVGFLAYIALAGVERWQDRVVRASAYGAITVALLGPSLWWIEHYRGLTEYVRNAAEMSRNEAQRTGIGWPHFALGDGGSVASFFDRDENATAWIYYMFLAVPLLVVGISVWRWTAVVRTGEPRVGTLVALSLMTALLWYSFLRGNLAARFGDMAAPAVVLGAYLLSQATERRGRSWPHVAVTTVLAVVVFGVTALGTWRLESVSSELRNSRLLEPYDVVDRARRASEELVGMPRSLRETKVGRMQAADYLHRCTRPTDRVIAVGYYPDVPAFSDRLFGGGRITFVLGYYADERYWRETNDKLESQSVPIVVGGWELDDPRFHLLNDYLRSRYDEVGMLDQASLRVLVRKGRQGTPTGPNGLPCFG